MPTENYELVGSYNNQRITSLDGERSINLFEYIDPLAKKPKSLLCTSGLINTNFNLLSASGGFRAQFVFQNDIYSVVGNTVLRTDSSGTSIILGTILNTVTGYVGIDANTFQVIFVDGHNGYIWDTIAATFKVISDTSFPIAPLDVCYLDGFFVVVNGNTNNFQLSQFNQGMVWGPASDAFTGSHTTSQLTLATTANYPTGLAVTLSVTGVGGTPFTASAATDMLTVSSTANFSPVGSTVVVNPITVNTSILPVPLAISTTYYTTAITPTTFKLAINKENALLVTPVVINLTTDGAPPNDVGALPQPLLIGTTYYVINVDNTHIKLATSFQNAELGVAITLTTDGTGTQTILSSGQLQQASVTTHPGTLVACRTLHRRLFLFSQNFTEVWENAGIGTNLPFRRNNALLMEYGTVSAGSISVGFDKLFFLSQDRDGLGAVMQVIGTESTPASTRALDFQLAQYAAAQQISDCRAFLIKENGLIFYRMNFTAANHTYVYNVTLSNPSSDETKLWHEEETLAGNRHPSQTHAYFNGINYVGHYSSPILYILDTNTFNNDGEAIARRRIGKPVVPSAYQRTRIDRFQIDLLQGNIALLNMTLSQLNIATENGDLIAADNGLLLVTDQGSQSQDLQIPEVFLSWSKDGGQTFGFQLVAPMGSVGNRSYRTLWRKLGVVPRGQAFVPKIEYFTNAPFIVMGASWSYEVLPE